MAVDLTKPNTDARPDSRLQGRAVADAKRAARWARHKIADGATVVADIIGDVIDDLDPWDFT